jgi:hypothetical protein
MITNIGALLNVARKFESKVNWMMLQFPGDNALEMNLKTFHSEIDEACRMMGVKVIDSVNVTGMGTYSDWMTSKTEPMVMVEVNAELGEKESYEDIHPGGFYIKLDKPISIDNQEELQNAIVMALEMASEMKDQEETERKNKFQIIDGGKE